MRNEMNEQTFSDSMIPETRVRLNEYVKNNPNLTNRTIAANTGLSLGTISLFRNDKYNGNNDEVAALIENYLDNEEAASKRITRGHLKFAMTTGAKSIFTIANYALTEGKIGVVTGVAGCGKTIAVHEFKKKKPTAILIEVSPIVTQKSLILQIAQELKIPLYAYRNENARPVPNYILFNEIIDKLKDTRRLLIIDESENNTVSCLEVIRRIQDFTGIGVLLVGTKRLLDRLRGPRRELQQLFSRVGIQKDIDLLQRADVRAILSINYPEAMKFADNFLQLSKNNGRLLEHLITLVKKTVEETGDELSVDLIDEAACSLLT